MNTEHSLDSERQNLEARVVDALAKLRGSIRDFRKATACPPKFLLEKSAPPIIPEALAKCKVVSGRNYYLKTLGKGGILAEIGTQKGDWARQMLDVVVPCELHLFDLSFNLLRKDVRDDERVTLHQGDSAKNLDAVSDHYFDLIYIDADHSYEGVERDIRQAVKKVKIDGVLMFNDYTQWSPMEAIPYGVVTAVNELLNAGEWEMVAIALTSTGYWDVALKRSGH